MIRLSFAELQEINAGIALALPQKHENQFLTPVKNTENETSSAAKSLREGNRLLKILNHVVLADGRAEKRNVS